MLQLRQRARLRASPLRRGCLTLSVYLRFASSTLVAQTRHKPSTWNHMSGLHPRRLGSSAQLPRPAGLFSCYGLVSPASLSALASRAEQRCNEAIDKFLRESPGLGRLDQVSNELCKVLDVAEFLRNKHPDPQWRQAADGAFTSLSHYMETLNARTDLYEPLRRLSEDHTWLSAATEEAKIVLRLLMADQERRGIHLPDERRHAIVELQNRINGLSYEYSQRLHGDWGYVRLADDACLSELSKSTRQSVLRQQDGSVLLPLDQDTVHEVLKHVRDPGIRKQVFIAANSGPVVEQSLQLLDNLVQARNDLAVSLGFKSFAHYTTSDKPVQTPEAVETLLLQLREHVLPIAQEEHRDLIQFKRQDVEQFRKDQLRRVRSMYPSASKFLHKVLKHRPGSSSSPNSHAGADVMEVTLTDAQRQESAAEAQQINAWDLFYYIGVLKAERHDISADCLSAYFSLDDCIKGLQFLCRSLYGVEIEEVALSPGEQIPGTGLRKFVVRQQDRPDCVLGVIYLDPFQRPGCFTGPATFMIRCGRRLLPDEPMEPGELYLLPEHELLRHSHSDKAPAAPYQTPVCVVSCSLRQDEGGTCLLSPTSMETLWHEFGHAMHAVLSRTEYQHLHGIRALVDFAEVPSQMMEYFANDHRVLRHFAEHYITRETIPAKMVKDMVASQQAFFAFELLTRITHALMDQRLFGVRPAGVSAQAMGHHVQKAIMLVPPVTDTAYPICRFSHFTNYGASYYSYLYSRMLVAALWRSLFAADPLSRQAGQRYRHELLRPGGARDPRDICKVLLGKEMPTPSAMLTLHGLSQTDATEKLVT